MQHGDHNEQSHDEAPAKFIAAIKQLRREKVFVPRSIDDAVLLVARKHLQPEEKSNRLFGSWLFQFATASAIAVVVLVGFLFLKNPRMTFAREDVNQDGRVDILDALALARQSRSGKTPAHLDLNGDGVVDRRDAEIIATHAVKLEKGNRS